MRRQELHLVDAKGEAVSPSIKMAVEAAFRWAVSEFPNIDSAIMANWAERLARYMQENIETLSSRI